MENSNSKQALIRLLTFIRDCEAEKPLDEINMGLIEACVKLLLKLQKKEIVFTTEQIKERVRKIPFVLTPDFGGETTKKVKKYTTKKKILLVAAIIAILCALLAVISIGHNIDYWHSVMNEKSGSVFNVPVGEEFVDGNDEFIHTGDSVKYTKTDKFFENEPYDVLIPTKLPDTIGLVDIMITSSTNTITVSFDAVITAYEIQLNTPLPQSIPESLKNVKTNNLSCYIDTLEGSNIVQIYFEYNGNFYAIGGTDEQILLDVIENLEEYK